MANSFEEEHFGILTDDELYLDCLMVRPAALIDAETVGVRVWVPHFPLTKTSTIVCARREAESGRSPQNVVQLTFDLRGTGHSEGSGESLDFSIDLRSIQLWAEERFGEKVKVTFMGLPVSRYGRVNLLPLRSGVVMESIYYPPNDNVTGPTVLYLSTFGTFDRFDDVRCGALAHLGYEVYGIDPLRYLLQASAVRLVTPADLLADLTVILEIIGQSATVIGQPLGAGLALQWGALSPQINGVIAIGRTEGALRAKHIFSRQPAGLFDLHKAVSRIAPRPVVYVWQEGHPLTGSKKDLADLYKQTGDPKNIERTSEISPAFLKKQLDWIAQKSA